MEKETTLNRVLQAIEYLKNNGKARTHEEIATLVKRLRPHVSAALKGDMKRFTEKFVKDFAAAYSDYINEEWLISGTGAMAKPLRPQRPHFDSRVSAGFLDGDSRQLMSAEMRDLITPLPDYDFTIQAAGDSMTPEIQDGDTLCCRIADDRLNPPMGDICVIDTKDGPVVKVIKETTEEAIVLHSFNPKYPDYSVEFPSINRIARVIGVIRILNQ